MAEDPKKYIGYVPKHLLPLRRGDIVKIPKGTMVENHRTGVKPAGRTYTVTVSHILSGAEYNDRAMEGPYYDGPQIVNPKIVWAGSGGYWSECDINDIREAICIGPNRSSFEDFGR